MSVPGLEIRPGRRADPPLLREVERAAASAFATTAHADLCDPGEDELLAPATLHAAVGAGTLRVALVDGDVVGFALLGEIDGAQHLRELDVRPEVGGRGIGTALLAAAMDLARDRGGASLVLTTFRDVPFNAPFYARNGFEEIDGAALGPALAALLAAERAAAWGGPLRCAMRARL